MSYNHHLERSWSECIKGLWWLQFTSSPCLTLYNSSSSRSSMYCVYFEPWFFEAL